jgi:hypothetical protein
VAPSADWAQASRRTRLDLLTTLDEAPVTMPAVPPYSSTTRAVVAAHRTGGAASALAGGQPVRGSRGVADRGAFPRPDG